MGLKFISWLIAGIGGIGFSVGAKLSSSFKPQVDLSKEKKELLEGFSSSGIITICEENIFRYKNKKRYSLEECNDLKNLKFQNSSLIKNSEIENISEKQNDIYFDESSDASSKLKTGKLKEKLEGAKASSSSKTLLDIGAKALSFSQIGWEPAKLKNQDIFWKKGDSTPSINSSQISWDSGKKKVSISNFSEKEKKYVGYEIEGTKQGQLHIKIWWFELNEKQGGIEEIEMIERELKLTKNIEFKTGEWTLVWKPNTESTSSEIFQNNEKTITFSLKEGEKWPQDSKKSNSEDKLGVLLMLISNNQSEKKKKVIIQKQFSFFFN